MMQKILIIEDDPVIRDELSRVFDRGFTGSNGRSRGGATGMGLYLCRKLLGFVFQDFNLLDTLTVEENIGLALTLNRADEPTGALDSKASKNLLEIMTVMNRYAGRPE